MKDLSFSPQFQKRVDDALDFYGTVYVYKEDENSPIILNGSAVVILQKRSAKFIRRMEIEDELNGLHKRMAPLLDEWMTLKDVVF